SGGVAVHQQAEPGGLESHEFGFGVATLAVVRETRNSGQRRRGAVADIHEVEAVDDAARLELVEIAGGRKLKRCDALRRVARQKNQREVVEVCFIVPVLRVVHVTGGGDVLEIPGVEIGRKRDVELRPGRSVGVDYAMRGGEENRRRDETAAAP